MKIIYNTYFGGIMVRLLAVCMTVAFVSCDSFLDIRPEGQLPESELLKDAQGFENALYGVYGSMRSESLYGKALSHEMIEVLAQYFDTFGNEYVDNLKTYNYRHSLLETALYNVWKEMYANISYLNNILISLDNMEESSMRYYDVYRGEALGLRAFLHFELLRLYTERITQNAGATGIPYSTKFELSPSEFSSAQKVYELIIADLEEAENLLKGDLQYFTFPKQNPEDNFLRDRETHFNLYAVQATLARVYLTMGDHENAAKYAEGVINSQKFDLMDKSDIANGAMKGILFPKETIFGLYAPAYFGVVQARFLLETSFFSYNLRRDMRSIYEFEQKGHDYRWEGFFRMPTTTAGAIRFTKLVDPFQVNATEFLRPDEAIVGINMIRLPEMYYIAAEALMNTNPVKAADYFDIVLESRGLMALKSRQPQEELTIERITAERYKEFIGEGQTFLNMKRLNLNIKTTDNATVNASNTIYVWPIPYDELEYNR